MMRKKRFLLTLASSLVTSAAKIGTCNYGVSFSPAGLLTPYHIGAAACLKDLGLITPKVGLSGSSGGALAAITSALLLDVPPEQLPMTPLEASVYVGKQCRDLGARGTLRIALDDVLEKLIPENGAELINARPAPCKIAFTAYENYGLSSQVVDHYIDKQDIIDCLRASCNIPFYFNGNAGLFVTARGYSAVDGFFAVDLRRFGCPPTGARKCELLISPFRASLVKIAPYEVRPKGSVCEYDIVSPDYLLGPGREGQWPFKSREIIQMAFTAPPSTRKPVPDEKISDEELTEKYRLLYEAGYQSIRNWYDEKGYTTWPKEEMMID